MSPVPANASASRWRQAWPDALAFAAGLGVAWWAHWETTDLVWSLWLSSLVVGYATIVWTISAPAREFAVNAAGEREPGTLGPRLLTGGLMLGGGLFLLAFFTVHFGMFHFVHSVFLNSFFPIFPGRTSHDLGPGLATYAEVVRRYWIFLPMAFLAERAAFAKPAPDDGAVTAAAIARRKARSAAGGGAMMAPYKNVVRMHLLIFFFAGASFAHLDSFLVYAVVYAVYFFPWRLLRSA